MSQFGSGVKPSPPMLPRKSATGDATLHRKRIFWRVGLNGREVRRAVVLIPWYTPGFSRPDPAMVVSVPEPPSVDDRSLHDSAFVRMRDSGRPVPGQIETI